MGGKHIFSIIIVLAITMSLMPVVLGQSEPIILPEPGLEPGARVNGMHWPDAWVGDLKSPVSGDSVISTAENNLMIDSTNIGNAWMISASGNTLQFKRGATATALTIDGFNGRVGIGTTTPATTFQIGTAGFQFDSAGKILRNSGGGAFILAAEGGNIVFDNNNDGNSEMVLTYSGNLGIGNSNPTEKLTLNGNIASSGSINAQGGLYLGNPATGNTGMLRMTTIGTTPVLQVRNGTTWLNISTPGGTKGEGPETNYWWEAAPGTICYGNNFTGDGGEPVCLHAGGSQWVALNAIYTNTWKHIDTSNALGLARADDGVYMYASPNRTAGADVTWNLGFKIPNQGGLLLPDITAPNPEVGTIKRSGVQLQIYNGSVWKDINDNSDIVIPTSAWVDCGEDLCYMGQTSGGSTTIYLYPSSNSLSGEWGCSNPSLLEYQCLRDNDDYLSTNEVGYSNGEYTIDDPSLIGYVINEVKVEARCRIFPPYDYHGYLYMKLKKGESSINTDGIPVTSNLWAWYNYTFSTSFSGQAWDPDDLNGMTLEFDGMAPYGVVGTGESSLVAGSMVLMADGSLKPIENVIVGEKVISYDIYTNEKVVREVTRTMKGFKKYLKINKELRLSEDHLVYVEGKGYVEAGDLVIGDKLIKSDGSTDVVYSLSELSEEEVAVYDFTVDEPSNFFADGYLVHNEQVLNFTHGSLHCQRARISVSYVPSSDAKVIINENSGSTSIMGGLSAKAIVSGSLIFGNHLIISSNITTEGKIVASEKIVTSKVETENIKLGNKTLHMVENSLCIEGASCQSSDIPITCDNPKPFIIKYTIPNVQFQWECINNTNPNSIYGDCLNACLETVVRRYDDSLCQQTSGSCTGIPANYTEAQVRWECNPAGCNVLPDVCACVCLDPSDHYYAGTSEEMCVTFN